MLFGPPRELLRRHVALAITYDDAAYPSVFVPAGDFFIEHGSGDGKVQSSNFETPYLAMRTANSWYCYFHMPYRKSVRLDLVASADIPGVVGGESWVQHNDAPFSPDEGYFHARFAYQPKLRFPWQPAVFSPVGGWKGPGQLVGLSMRFSAPKEWAAQFPGTMEHVCEGTSCTLECLP